MVVLIPDKEILEEGEVAISADWEVSTDPNFHPDNIVVSTHDDTVSIWHKIYSSLVLDYRTEYYGRVRYFIEPRGYTKWSNLDVFIPEKYKTIERSVDHPTYVAPPILTTNSEQEAHRPLDFIIFMEEPSMLGNATIEATTWIIEDMEGDVIWFVEKDIHNKTSIHVDNIALEYGQAYIIKAYIHSSSSDISSAGTLVIHVKEDNAVGIKSQLTEVRVDEDTVIELLDISGVASSKITIYNKTPTSYVSTYTASNSGANYDLYTIPAGTLEETGVYTVLVNYILNDGSSTAYASKHITIDT